MAEPEPHPVPRRSFTEEFKRDAVRLATERGNVSVVARDHSSLGYLSPAEFEHRALQSSTSA